MIASTTPQREHYLPNPMVTEKVGLELTAGTPLLAEEVPAVLVEKDQVGAPAPLLEPVNAIYTHTATAFLQAAVPTAFEPTMNT